MHKKNYLFSISFFLFIHLSCSTPANLRPSCKTPLEPVVSTLESTTLKQLRGSIGSIEDFLTSYSENCSSGLRPKTCEILNNWLTKQIQKSNFLPEQNSWIDGDWVIEKENNTAQQEDWSILSTKILAHIANAYRVIREQGFSALKNDKSWFVRRLAIYKPIYGWPEPYLLKDEGASFVVKKAAHNISSAHSRASAIVAWTFNDKKLFKKTISQWQTTLSSVRKDGSLAIEVRRGARALYYSNQVLSDVLALYFIGQKFDIDLLETYPKTKRTLHNAVRFILRSLHDFKIIESYAKSNKYPGPSKKYKVQDLRNLRGRMAWLLIYFKYWPHSPNVKLARTTLIDPAVCSPQQRDFGSLCSKKNNIKLIDIVSQDRGITLGFRPSCFLHDF